MKIDGNSPSQPVFGGGGDGPAPLEPGRLGRWTGLPGTPGPSRLGSGEEPKDDPGALERLAQREPRWGEDLGVEETIPEDFEPLHAWLSASPANIHRYTEDHLMDALLKDFFRKETGG